MSQYPMVMTTRANKSFAFIQNVICKTINATMKSVCHWSTGLHKVPLKTQALSYEAICPMPYRRCLRYLASKRCRAKKADVIWFNHPADGCVISISATYASSIAWYVPPHWNLQMTWMTLIVAIQQASECFNRSLVSRVFMWMFLEPKSPPTLCHANSSACIGIFQALQVAQLDLGYLETGCTP